MIVTARGKKVKLPDFLIVGAAKSGTSALYYYLIQHSQIYMPKIKEPQFFSFMECSTDYKNSDSLRNKVIWEFEDYIKLFEPAEDGKITGEASTIYLNKYNDTINNIKLVYGKNYKNLKIIAILRNPVDRAFSQYFHNRKTRMETLPFEKAINRQVIEDRLNKYCLFFDYIGFGMYYQQVKAYMEKFQHVKIYLFEDLKNPKDLLIDLFEFLNIDTNVEINTDTMFNPSGIPKNMFLVDLLFKVRGQHILAKPLKAIIPQKYMLKLVSYRDNILKKLLVKPEMNAVMREKLISIYRNDILELQELINRDLSHWLEVKR